MYLDNIDIYQIDRKRNVSRCEKLGVFSKKGKLDKFIENLLITKKSRFFIRTGMDRFYKVF
jgi:hypothetical protein